MLGRSSTEAILRLVRQNFTALCLDEVHLGTGAILRLLGQQGVVKNHLGTGPLVSLMGHPGTFWSPGELSRTGPGIVPFRRRRLTALRVTALAMLGKSSTEDVFSMAQQHLITLGTGPLLSIIGHLGESSCLGSGTVPFGNSCITALWVTTLAMLGRSSTEEL
jgi:hypothetical protein